MPVHRVTVAEIESAIADIEKTERIVSVTPVGDQSVLVFTEPSKRRAPGAIETRA